jgi:hypothetical protein
MFFAGLFTEAMLWNQPRSPSTDKWIKLCSLHINNGIVFRNKKIISTLGKWMMLEIIMLSKINQILKDKYVLFSNKSKIFKKT